MRSRSFIGPRARVRRRYRTGCRAVPPSCRRREPRAGRVARIACRSSAGAVTIELMASAMLAGDVGSHRTPAPVLADDRRHPGQVRCHDRHPGGEALEQLLGRRVAVVEGRRLDGHDRRRPQTRSRQQLVRRHRRQHHDPPGVRRPRVAASAIACQGPNPSRHEDRPGDLEDGVHRLLDAPLRS